MVAVPEIRTLVERGAARRQVLEGLIESVPDDYWERQDSGDAWTALDHLRHVATVDQMLVELVEAAQESDEELWAGKTDNVEVLEARRVALMDKVREQSVDTLVETMRESRARAVGTVLGMTVETLDREVRVAGALNEWGEQLAFPLRGYLAVWVEHDGEHEAAIRRAIATPPDVTTLTLAARRARESR
ncbi:MAG: DinB family protein [Chloroflexi bacterium]|nr:DinB family protein [Chloroflexota bacterium]